jgi:uncharacterized membrane protein
MGERRLIFLIYFLTLLGILVWIGAIFLAPYLKSHSKAWNIFVYAIFSPICHQVPSRSFFFFGYPLAVCGRCLGIYSGFFFGVGLYPFVRGFSAVSLPKTRIFILISLPIVTDTAGNFLNLWNSPNLARFATGFLWGTILPFYFITGLVDLFRDFRQKYSLIFKDKTK